MKYFIIVASLQVLACSTDGKRQEEKTEDSRAKTYQLVWNDEFDYTGKPAKAKWNYEYGFIRNNERQYYTDSLKNARVEDGYLLLEAHREEMANTAPKSSKGENLKENRARELSEAEYTSASITTKNLAEWTYGKIEVSAKLPKGRGMWPAIWMLGANIDQVNWPKCGEIDIMEHVGFEKDTIYGTVHTEAYNHTKGTEKGGSTHIDTPYSEFHVYAVEWTPDKIDFLLDGKVYQQFLNERKTPNEWPFDQPFHLKLNVAVGGSWGGQKGIDDNIFPQQMSVDYVRVYQLK